MSFSKISRCAGVYTTHKTYKEPFKWQIAHGHRGRSRVYGSHLVETIATSVRLSGVVGICVNAPLGTNYELLPGLKNINE
jgi:hypothetical protein